MYAARCIAVSLAFFVLSYCALSCAVVAGWNLLDRRPGKSPLLSSAAFLFCLRSFPPAASLVLTLVFTLPSFLLLEPRSTGEAIGRAPSILGLCCLGLFLAGLTRATAAQTRASRALSAWLSGATVLSAGDKVPVFRTRPGAPVVAVAGVCLPKVLVSESALAVLNEREWQTSLKHELAHVRNQDNLKKLLFQFSPFPGMAALERVWADAAELEADDAAVSNRADALDLASALIKLSRLAPLRHVPLTTGLVHGSAKLVLVRVERLFAWSESASPVRTASLWRYAAPSLAAAVFCAGITYGAMLVEVHQITEWLVR